MKKVIHPANSRDTANSGWLYANYSFSFAKFFIPDKIQFDQIWVSHDEFVQGDIVFETHPFENMEITSIPLKGKIRHKDSVNHTAVMKAGKLPLRSAGTGAEQRKFQRSKEDLNILQIFIGEEKNGMYPDFDPKDFSNQIEQEALLNIVNSRTNKSSQALVINHNPYHPGELQAGREIDLELKNEDHAGNVFFN